MSFYLPDLPGRHVWTAITIAPDSFMDRLRVFDDAFGAAFGTRPSGEEPVNIQQSDRRVERRARRILDDQPEWARPNQPPVGYAGRSEPTEDEET